MNQPSHGRDTPANRRDFYRIDDEVILKYRELGIGPGDSQADGDREQIGLAFLACARLAEYRHRMQPLLSEVRRESPAIARLLGLLDEKSDLLAGLLLQEDVNSMVPLRSRVQLSAGGIAFRTREEFRNEAIVSIQMILLPSFVGITTEGRVVRGKKYLREIDGCLYETTVEFVNMKESTRDLIAKHVLARKTEQLRDARQ